MRTLVFFSSRYGTMEKGMEAFCDFDLFHLFEYPVLNDD